MMLMIGVCVFGGGKSVCSFTMSVFVSHLISSHKYTPHHTIVSFSEGADASVSVKETRDGVFEVAVAGEEEDSSNNFLLRASLSGDGSGRMQVELLPNKQGQGNGKNTTTRSRRQFLLPSQVMMANLVPE